MTFLNSGLFKCRCFPITFLTNQQTVFCLGLLCEGICPYISWELPVDCSQAGLAHLNAQLDMAGIETVATSPKNTIFMQWQYYGKMTS